MVYRPHGKVMFSEVCHLVAATAAVSTHPTRMHSCLNKNNIGIIRDMQID